MSQNFLTYWSETFGREKIGSLGSFVFFRRDRTFHPGGASSRVF